VRRRLGSIFVAAVVALACVQLAVAAETTTMVKISSDVTLKTTDEFSGRVVTEKPCRDQRTVEIHAYPGDALLWVDKTGTRGRYHVASTYIGQAYARVLRKRIDAGDQSPDAEDGIDGGEDDVNIICRSGRSPVRSFGSQGD
jgi:hypothetical protein